MAKIKTRETSLSKIFGIEQMSGTNGSSKLHHNMQNNQQRMVILTKMNYNKIEWIIYYNVTIGSANPL